MKIHEMRKDDFNEIYKLWKMAGLGLLDKNSEKVDYLSVLEINKKTCLKITLNRQIIATALGTWNGRRAWIYHFAVRPDFQKVNFGSILMKNLLDRFGKMGVKNIILSVSLSNLKVVPFYEKNGFSVMNDALLLKYKTSIR